MDGFAVGNVAGESEDTGGVAACGCSERCDGGFELVCVSSGDGDGCAVLEEAFRDAESDTAVTAGYEGDLVVEVEWRGVDVVGHGGWCVGRFN